MLLKLFSQLCFHLKGLIKIAIARLRLAAKSINELNEPTNVYILHISFTNFKFLNVDIVIAKGILERRVLQFFLILTLFKSN